jgi:hypothetical protein
LKPARAISSIRPYLEKTLHKKRVGAVAQGVGPEFKPQYHKKRKKERKEKGMWTEVVREGFLEELPW